VSHVPSQRESSIIDISPEVSPHLAVFPGDTGFSQKVLSDCQKGDSFGLSSFTTTPHIGAHTDAPNHYSDSGVGISDRNLDYYYGRCQVITVKVPLGERVLPEHIKNIPITAPRVLFRTDSYPNPYRWSPDFNSLSPELVELLDQLKVILVGIDTPSIDLANDRVLKTHHMVHKKNMAILEGIVLTNVTDGIYTLIALPLKMKGLDASPVRAVLVQDT
jgi:arylformamidase